MVLYFKARDGSLIYMGKDKYENEKLIKFGWPEDVWFHVDSLSSAHVYVRLSKEKAAKFQATNNLDFAPELIEDCCQLVKANSIEGCKKAAVDIVYTAWSNLNKTSGMDTGQIGYKDMKIVVKVKDVPRKREVIKAIEKTREEKVIDYEKERQERDSKEAQQKKHVQKQKMKVELNEKKQRQEEADKRDYDKHLMKEEWMVSNEDMASSKDTSAAVDYEEDFM